MMKIEIEIKSIFQSYSVLVDTDQNILLCNSKQSNLNPSNFANKVLDIVLLWDPTTIAPIVATDVETCKVYIETIEKTFNYYYAGNFPKSYKEFKELVLEVVHE